MRCACIDIGSNTTALLVADLEDGEQSFVAARRAFTLLGATLEDGRIGATKVDEVCAAAQLFTDYARKVGCCRVVIVATHVVREAADAGLLTQAVERACGTEVRILTSEEEARYSFAGATGGNFRPDRPTTVIDAGGGSTEITWHTGEGSADDLDTQSFAIGSSSVRSGYLLSDPPTEVELAAARTFADGAFASLRAPAGRGVALAVGGGATTAREIVGGLIDERSVERVLKLATSMDSETLADRLEIEWQRALLLPAGLTVLAAVSAKLALPLEVGRGGLREGVLFELSA